MPSLAVYGDSGMGKSMLVEKFKDDYALSTREKPRAPKVKLLVVELAGRPNERRLFAQILAVLGAPQNAPQSPNSRGPPSAFWATSGSKCWFWTRSITFSPRPGANSASSSTRCLSLVCFGIMEGRQAINGDVQLARRFNSVSLPRWIAGKEFEQLVLAIVRNLPLKEPSVLTVKGLRRILLASDEVSARIFRMLNDVAIEAIETGVERITDEALERYKPVGEDEATFQ